MSNYVCSNCGASAYYDGRCGDGPVLTCPCTKRGHWVDDGRGGYMVYPNDAHPVDKESTPSNWDDYYWYNETR
jgi:hypothetical protein